MSDVNLQATKQLLKKSNPELNENEIEELANESMNLVKTIFQMSSRINNLESSLKNLFAIMDATLPSKILKQEAYLHAKSLIK